MYLMSRCIFFGDSHTLPIGNNNRDCSIFATHTPCVRRPFHPTHSTHDVHHKQTHTHAIKLLINLYIYGCTHSMHHHHVSISIYNTPSSHCHSATASQSQQHINIGRETMRGIWHLAGVCVVNSTYNGDGLRYELLAKS